MKSLLTVFFLTCSCIACNNNKEARTNTAQQEIKYDYSRDSSVYSGEMKRYWLVLLKKGHNRNQDSMSAALIQAGHMANINRLAMAGKIIMAGPMGSDGDLRGIFIMDCKDSAEVEQYVKTDTAVITGRLAMEYYPWWAGKGKYIFK